ncbi:hypothetical protein CC86DRAFT_429240 [Ophiobolus disseminans]|uniref:Uncharacterized protein n=1 Tax=Ophiobolus disseminans TaxID=1469910 RepID=A0A6A6ZHS5_9PLEO|nr:hypothetical protein CC86DRAFT_429240 [Ophiobolus disseminans]
MDPQNINTTGKATSVANPMTISADMLCEPAGLVPSIYPNPGGSAQIGSDWGLHGASECRWAHGVEDTRLKPILFVSNPACVFPVVAMHGMVVIVCYRFWGKNFVENSTNVVIAVRGSDYEVMPSPR